MQKRMIVGALGLAVGSVWLVLLVAQGPQLTVARMVLTSDAPVLFRLSVLPTLAVAAAAAALALPLLLAGIGAMLAVPGGMRVLRRCSQLGLAVSVAVVVAFGAMVLPTFGAGFSPAQALQLAGSANLAVLQALLLWLIREPSTAGLRIA